MNFTQEVPFREAMSVVEFCRCYGISRSSAYRQMDAGRLPFRKCGARRLIARRDADCWLASLPTEASLANPTDGVPNDRR
jgi:excisionase family DNA binding protein